MSIRAVLTDIEGTTSSIAFVHRVLFPYARAHLAAFLATRADEPAVAALLADTRVEAGLAADAPLAEIAAVLDGWMAADRKATPLKMLQGLIWEEGYRHGDFRGHVYEDAARRLAEWYVRGLKLYVYSSGSVHAQQLLFGHSEAGDMCPLFSGWFDTTSGAKRDADAYRRIAAAIGLPADAILFLSDVAEELDAACAAGLATCQLVRPQDGTCACPRHPQAADFDAVRF